MLQLFDVHCHLQDRRLENGILEGMLERAEIAGLKNMLSCGVHEGDWQRLDEISKKFSGILPAYGIHPWFIQNRSGLWLDYLEKRISESTAAVGEIGIDKMVKTPAIEEQVEVFVLQLRLAATYSRPVSVHCRKAWGLLADLLEKEGGFSHGGAIHSYSGSADMVPVFEKLGASISFSGSVCNPANKKTSKAATAVSDGRLLIETDAPDILPYDAPAGLNEPGHLSYVVKALSDLRGQPINTICDLTFQNAIRLYQPDTGRNNIECDNL